MKGRGKTSIIAVLAALATLLVPTALGTIAGTAVASSPKGDIPIDETTFPDEAFRNFVKDHWDTDGSGVLSEQERGAVGELQYDNTDGTKPKFISLKGIEYAPNLSTINITNTALETLDLSGNPGLRSVTVTANPLYDIDLTQSGQLQRLTVDNNDLSHLDTSHCTNLEDLHVVQNHFVSLDISHNARLRTLNASNNALTSIAFPEHAALTDLVVGNNQFTAIDVAQLTNLHYLSIAYNPIRSIDVSHNDELYRLDIDGDAITKLDLTHNAKLRDFRAAHVDFPALNLSHNQNLFSLVLSTKCMKSLDLTSNPLLYSLTLDGGTDGQSSFTSLKLPAGEELRKLAVTNNPALTTIDISHDPAVFDVNVANNNLSSFDITNNTELYWLDISGNPLPNFDISGVPQLVEFSAERTGTTAVDLTHNSELWTLNLGHNKLASVDVTNIAGLKELRVNGNALSALDVSQNPALDVLDVAQNKLTYLHVPQAHIGNDGTRGLQLLNVTNSALLGLDVAARPQQFETGSIDDPDYAYYTTNEQLDFAQTAPAMDPHKITAVSGGTLTDAVLTPDSIPGTVRYQYDMGAGMTWNARVEFIEGPAPQFTDVNESTPHKADIDWIARRHITEGYLNTDGTKRFEPMGSVNRQDMAAFLRRVAVKNHISDAATWEPTEEDWNRFSDVHRDTPHAEDILWLAHASIAQGYKQENGPGTFGPMIVVYRQDMAAFIRRFASLAGKSDDVEPKSFTDVTDATPHADDIRWLGGTTIAEGYKNNDGTYRYEPMTSTYRQDMAAFLHRLDTFINTKPSAQ
ncbi:repeat protein [Bifidobacterium dolichotidis]|uniref:Repeat protein n=1 Tax=Bifidobacterium dolichotidis TaxID=2306976 RepID=A0A430FQ82_9BIFI|nr:hypothetical protein [Bifidobacterium dolichotidis]RSX54990.1 repeat protein [Bifidobacterium dolichotidis]